MDLLTLLIVLVVVGVALWLVQLIPMDPTIKRILTVAVIVIVALWVLKALFGDVLSGVSVG